jgi:hypothetical protein
MFFLFLFLFGLGVSYGFVRLRRAGAERPFVHFGDVLESLNDYFACLFQSAGGFGDVFFVCFC